MIPSLFLALLAAVPSASLSLPSAQMQAAIAHAAQAKLAGSLPPRFKWLPENHSAAIYCGWIDAKAGWTPFLAIGSHKDGPVGAGDYLVGDLRVGSSDPANVANTMIANVCPNAGYDLTRRPSD